MVWLWVLVIVVLIGAVAVVAVGRGGSMTDVYDDRPDSTLPMGRPLTADDIREVRFTTAVRGYRMDEVDAFLARLGADLLARETREGPSPTPSHLALDDSDGPDTHRPDTDEPDADSATDAASEDGGST